MKGVRTFVLVLPVAAVALPVMAANWTSDFSAAFDGYEVGERLQDKSSKGAVGGKWQVAEMSSATAASDGERMVMDVSCSQVDALSFHTDDPVGKGKAVRVSYSMKVEAFAMTTNTTPGIGVAGAVMTVSDAAGRPQLVGWSSVGWSELGAEGLVLECNKWIDGFIELKTLGESRYVSYAAKVGEKYVRLKDAFGRTWLPTIPADGGSEISQVGYFGVGQLARTDGETRDEEISEYVWSGGESGGWDDAANWTDADGGAVARAPGTTGDVVRISGSVALTNGGERVTVSDLTLGFFDGMPQRFDGAMRGEVSLDVSRPRLGKKLVPEVATFLGFAPEYGYRYLRGDSFKAYEAEPVSQQASYAPTADDLGHWLRLEVADAAGTVASSEFFFSRLPVVYIDTEDGDDINVKTEYENAVLRVQGNDEFKEQYNGKTEIKGRGNSSWGFPKKPYKLKLDKKTDLFGYGKNKHWVLLSNWLDECYQRNVLAGDLAEEVGVLRMNMVWVDVVFNGQLRGNYLLGEHIRVDENRVNVFDWSDTIESDGHEETDLSWLDEEQGIDFSGGYIYELSAEYDNVAKFTTGSGLKVMVDTPEYAHTSAKMFGTMQKFWADFESAYRSESGYGTNGQHYAEMVDLDSMVGFWLVNETMGNNDAAVKSRYAYKDRGEKLRFGPVWDFDWGCGSVADAWPTGWKVCARDDAGNIYREWLDDPLFCLRAFELYWGKVRPFMMEKVLNEGGLIDQRHDYLAESAAADKKRWEGEPKFISGYNWSHRWFEADTVAFKNYLTQRMAWLDEQFATVDTLMAKVKTDKSASPYEKATTGAEIAAPKGEAREPAITSGDWSVTNARDFTIELETDIANAASVEFYMNGFTLARDLQIVNGECSITVGCERMDAASGKRNLLSVIVRDISGNVLARNYAAFSSDGTPEADSIKEALVNELGFDEESDVVSNVTSVAEYAKFRDFVQSGGLATATPAQRTLAYTSYQLSPLLMSPYLFSAKPELKVVEFAEDAPETAPGVWDAAVELKDGTAAVAMSAGELKGMVLKSDNFKDWTAVDASNVLIEDGESNRVILKIKPDFSGDAGYLKLSR